MKTLSNIGSAITSLIMGMLFHEHLLKPYEQLIENIIAKEIYITITKTRVTYVRPKLSTPDSGSNMPH